MTEEDDGEKHYVFLQERSEKWLLRLDAFVFVVVISFALFCAAYSDLGFWAGLWNIVKPA